MKSLVAYFSASGNTGALAAHLAKAADAGLFRIEPVDPYTEADLRWTNPLARCNREKIGKKDVPISGRVDNWDEYECVFIGFPVWYYGAPKIIETFVKSYDFTSKKVAFFATSGGSDVTKVAGKLGPMMKGEIIGSQLFQPDASVQSLKKWVESL